VKYAQCVKTWPFDVLVLFLMCVLFSEVLRLVSDGHYTKLGNSSVSDEEKGRHAHATTVLYLRRKETRPRNARLVSQEHVYPFYLTYTKKIVNRILSTGCSLRQPATVPIATNTLHICSNMHPVGLAQEGPRGA
jgi:hypothetical protein